MGNKVINIILIVWLLLIVIFVTNNNPTYQKIWDLGYYLSYYCIVFIAFRLCWLLFYGILTRSLLISVVFYYGYHLIIQVIEVFNQPLKQLLYQGKYINYILGISLGLSILILPLIKTKKK
jgi:hypothetical protein